MMQSVHNFSKRGGGQKHAILRTDMETGTETMFAGNLKIGAAHLGVEESKLRSWIARRVVVNGFRYKFDR